MSQKEPNPKSLNFIAEWSIFNQKCKEMGIDYRASAHLFTENGDKLFVESSQPLRSSRAATVDLLDNGDVRVLEHSYNCIGVIAEGNANIWHNQAMSTTIEGGSEHIERYYEEVVDLILSVSKDKK